MDNTESKSDEFGICSAQNQKNPKNIGKWVCPLGGIELSLYFMVWILHSASAVYVTYRVSFSDKNGKWMEHWMQPSDYVAGYRMDNSDLEWKLFRKSIFETITTHVLHSVIFHITIRRLDRTKCSLVLIPFWLLLHLYWTSFRCILVIAIHVFLTTTITFYTRTQVCAWISCLVFVVKAGVWAPFSSSPNNYYREFNMYLYTSIQILNFCIYLAKQRKLGSLKIDSRLMLSYLEYLLYPMYSTALIVLLKTFISKASIAYIAGQFFHIKYVLIFGVPRLFASIDGFSPPGPPICISRVSKYSLMWRHFDQGLYQFLKNQVYIPLLGSSSNLQMSVLALSIRRFLAMVCVFLFVLSWHGPSSTNYLSWVCLSALELCIERVGKDLIAPSTYWSSLKSRIGSANTMRLTAISMLATVMPGIFGVFFFLSQAGVGNHIFEEVLVKGLFGVFVKPWKMKTGDPGFVMLHLLILGYCFNCVCIYLEHRYRKSESGDSKDLKKKE